MCSSSGFGVVCSVVVNVKVVLLLNIVCIGDIVCVRVSNVV